MPPTPGPEAASSTVEKRRIDLDFTRGIAILLAVGSHFNYRDTGYALIDLVQLPGRHMGWAGVDLFFVLSGFLVGGLIFREYHKRRSFDARRFLIRRAFKIWPVMYFYILLVVVTGRYQWWEVLPQTLFHVQNFFATPLKHLWSLAVEEHFYLAAAFLFGRLAQSHRATIRVIPATLAGLMLTALVLRVIATCMGAGSQPLQWQTQFRIDSLCAGVMLAYLSVFEPEVFRRLAARKTATLLIAAAGVLFLARTQHIPWLLATAGYTVAYLTAAAFLLTVYDLPIMNRSRWAAALGWVGSYSYPMYLLQFVAFRVAEAVWRRLTDAPIPPLVELIGLYAGAILIAVVAAKLIERPMLALRNRLFPSVAG